MKTMTCVGASALLFAACASVEKINVAKGTGAAGATYFCSKTRLTEQGNTMVCNWKDSAKAACRSHNLGYLEKAAITSGPKEGGRCDTGEWLVQVTAR